MKNNNTNVTAADKILVCLIFIVVALVSAIATFTATSIIYKNKYIESLESTTEAEETYVEDKDEVQDLAFGTSMLPQHYILTTMSGSDVITHNMFVNKIIYSDNGSYIVETSSDDKIIFKDGMCIIHKHNDLVEIFTEYSFTLENTN